jgi:hypothetical protein
MSPVRLPDEDGMRMPKFRDGRRRWKRAAPAPPEPPKEPCREEGPDPREDVPRTPKEDER